MIETKSRTYEIPTFEERKNYVEYIFKKKPHLKAVFI